MNLLLKLLVFIFAILVDFLLINSYFSVLLLLLFLWDTSDFFALAILVMVGSLLIFIYGLDMNLLVVVGLVLFILKYNYFKFMSLYFGWFLLVIAVFYWTLHYIQTINGNFVVFFAWLAISYIYRMMIIALERSRLLRV